MMDITTLGNQRIDQKTFEQLLKHIKLKVTEEYAFPPEIITCGGATIATLGNFLETSVLRSASQRVKRRSTSLLLLLLPFQVKRFLDIRHTCQKTRRRFFILIQNRASTTAIRFWSEY